MWLELETLVRTPVWFYMATDGYIQKYSQTHVYTQVDTHTYISLLSAERAQEKQYPIGNK